MEFEPFSCQFDDISDSDIYKLKSINEGWYIEYKGSMVGTKVIAKSVSSFANTYGGYLFFGVQEKSKSEAVAGAFPGLESSRLSEFLQLIRQSIKEHLHPTPHFDIKVVHGPSALLEFSADRCIIVVRVPRSADTPHVHSSGCVFKRVGDSSEPVSIKDQGELRELHERGERLDRFWNRWIEEKPQLLAHEGNITTVRIMLTADPRNTRPDWPNINMTQFKSLLKDDGSAPFNIPFDNFFIAPRGFVARQVMDNQPVNTLLTFALTSDFRSEFIIPARHYKLRYLYEEKGHFSRYRYLQEFVSHLRKCDWDETWIIDLTQLYTIVGAIVAIQGRLAEHFDWHDTLYARVEVENALGLYPFFDIEEYLTYILGNGLPLSLRKHVAFPERQGAHGFLPYSFNKELSIENSLSAAEVEVYSQSTVLFGMLCMCFGIPSIWASIDPSDKQFGIISMIDAANRVKS